MSVSLDFWSKAVTSFLGINIHFIQNDELQCITASLKYVEYPHTAEKILKILEDILKEWSFSGINDPKISAFITDNGSNFVKAFKDLNSEFFNNDDSEEDSHNSADEMESSILPSISNIRIGCMDHALVNNLKSAISKSSELNSLLDSVKNMVTKIKYNGKSSDFLKSKQEAISLPPKTRWLYHFELVSKFLQIKASIDHCCESILLIDSIPLTKTKVLENVQTILRYYKDCTELLQYSNSQTLSNVIPVLFGLESHLKNYVELECQLISNFSKNLLSDYKTRFKHVIDPKCSNFQIKYCLATFLDPETRFYLSNLYELNSTAINFIKNKFTDYNDCMEVIRPSGKLSKFCEKISFPVIANTKSTIETEIEL